MKLAEKKGKQSVDVFKVGARVRAQCPKSRRWELKGEIIESCQVYDEEDVSFVVKMDNGNESNRHKTHLKHDVDSNERTENVKVQFNDQVYFSDNSDQSETELESHDYVMTRGRAQREKLKIVLRSRERTHSP